MAVFMHIKESRFESPHGSIYAVGSLVLISAFLCDRLVGLLFNKGLFSYVFTRSLACFRASKHERHCTNLFSEISVNSL